MDGKMSSLKMMVKMTAKHACFGMGSKTPPLPYEG
jgi:hypothetical protein